jgi:hypothetical protein
MLKYLLPILYLQKVFPMDLSLEKQKRNLRSKFKGCSHVEVLFSHDRKKNFYFNKKKFLEG